jgi:hypothetical protein
MMATNVAPAPSGPHVKTHKRRAGDDAAGCGARGISVVDLVATRGGIAVVTGPVDARARSG